MAKILITSALPYANGALHFGHIAGAYLPADAYARFCRLMGHEVLFICGSDEYGIANTISAEACGRTPKEHVDLYHEINKSFFEKLGISFDHYSRTSWEGHFEPTFQYFNDLLQNGYIKERITDQLYSPSEKKFLADRYVVGICPKCGFDGARGDECQKCGASYEATDLKNPRSKLSGSSLVLKPTKHWFLLLDKLQEKVISWLEKKEWKANVLQFAKNYAENLHARAITRDLNWGVPVPLPGAEGKVLYVWFDAPIGYISATKEWALKIGKPEEWKRFWCDQETKLVQFVGKDNIPFHAVIFPAMTMGQNQPYKLVDELPANEFYNLEGRQFSKSEGWTIDLERFFERYSVDQIRYTIAANAPETGDSEFSWKDFQMRCNGELAGKLGNFANRVLVFAKTHMEGVTPELLNLRDDDLHFLNKVAVLVQEAEDAFDGFHLRRACQILMEIASLGNVYFDAQKPWVDAKDSSKHLQMRLTIGCSIQCLKALALVSLPIIPTFAHQLWELLGFTDSMEELGWPAIVTLQVPPFQKLKAPTILFQKIEEKQIEEEIANLKSLQIKGT